MMDKKKFKVMLMAFVLSLALVVPISYSVGANAQTGGAAAGSIEDPLVTVSYVSQYVAQHGGDTSFEIIQLTQDQ